ncbi:hypothetical protein RHGRI_018636 [Rhododendron griersonianum]|uniref:Uncharacterized protein n=1 Tax=Rhododendron griersonianum TaxID=479676 RepID=A0AAV6K291_9ERIC|nr:hypothetical protein RHGRI_018636 [Rhododendron griersonianum]
MMAQITPPLSFLLLGKREGGLEVSLRQMDELSPHHPSGTVSFCQRFTPVQWSSFSRFLETGEALDDYAKFRSSLMGTYASLTMSIASDNKVIFTVLCIFFPIERGTLGRSNVVSLLIMGSGVHAQVDLPDTYLRPLRCNMYDLDMQSNMKTRDLGMPSSFIGKTRIFSMGPSVKNENLLVNMSSGTFDFEERLLLIDIDMQLNMKTRDLGMPSSFIGKTGIFSMGPSVKNENLPYALMGWHCGDELERLKSYNVAANVRSSMKHDDNLDELLDEFQLFNVTTDPVGKNVWRYKLHLKGLHFLHQLYAYRKALAKLDFIKCDSDFDEVFQRLKSEKQWTDISDGTLRHALAQHFSLLRKLNDDLGMIGLASASKMLEGDKLLEAIENEYSQEVSDLIKVFKERNMRDFFSDHMEAKILQRKLFDQAESSRTVMLPKECHFTSPKLSPLIDRALVHRSQALEKFLELKGRWGRSIGGLRSKLWPVAVVFAGIPAAYIGGTGMRKG